MPGYYTIRLTRGAIEVPARIFLSCACTVLGGQEQLLHDWTLRCDRSPVVIGMICGEPCEAEKVWLSGSLKDISKADYELLLKQTQWDKKYAPDSPLANPRQKMDFLKTKLPF
jgi:hypothetical protein